MRKLQAPDIGLGGVIRLASALILVLGVVMLTMTGIFIKTTLDWLSNPSSDGSGTELKNDVVNDALLIRLLQDEATRRSADRTMPTQIVNPFRTAAPTPAPAPAPEPAPPTAP